MKWTESQSRYDDHGVIELHGIITNTGPLELVQVQWSRHSVASIGG